MLRRGVPLRMQRSALIRRSAASSAAVSSSAVASRIAPGTGGFTCVRHRDRLPDLADDSGAPMQMLEYVHDKSGMRLFHFCSATSDDGVAAAARAATQDKAAAKRERATHAAEAAAAAPSTAAAGTACSVHGHSALKASTGEKALCLGFCTPPENDSGVTHILEHTVLCGSREYPQVRDPFFKMLRRSLNTFMNAMTGPDQTVYPFATTNEKDFFNLLSVYADCCFFPLLRATDFAQEAHRLELRAEGSTEVAAESDPVAAPSVTDGDVTAKERAAGSLARTGVVLNEMKGALSDPLTHFQTALAANTMGRSPYAFAFGGDPAAIPLLTHNALVEYHRRHYAPSNAIVSVVDSAVTNTDTAAAFLTRVLTQLGAVADERLRVDEAAHSAEAAPHGAQSKAKAIYAAAAATGVNAQSPLERLRTTFVQDVEQDARSEVERTGCSFSFGPPEPVSSDCGALEQAAGEDNEPLALTQRGQTMDVKAATAGACATFTTARIATVFPIGVFAAASGDAAAAAASSPFAASVAPHMATSGVAAFQGATAEQHRALLKTTLLFDALLRAPSGPLYRALLVDPASSALLSSPTAEAPAAAKDGGSATAPSSSSSSGVIVDLLPGSGANMATQGVSLVVGLQNVPVQYNVRATSRTPEQELAAKKRAHAVCAAKATHLREVTERLLRDALAEGLDEELVFSCLHAYELGLRARPRDFNVRTACAVADAVIRGLSVDHSFEVTDAVAEIRRGLFPTGAPTPGAKTHYFDDILRDAVLPYMGAARSVAVAADPKHLERLAAAAATDLEHLEATFDAERRAEVRKHQAAVEDAQRNFVENVEALPTLTVADISPQPSRRLLAEPAHEETFGGNSTKLSCFVVPTGGLVHVNMLLPIPAHWNGDTFDAKMVPLLCDVMDKCGFEGADFLEQDSAVRQVCSGFACTTHISSVLADTRPGERELTDRTHFLRGVRISFDALPQNVPKALDLLARTLEANMNGHLWSKVLPKDERTQRQFAQQLTTIVNAFEGRVSYEGTAFAQAAAFANAITPTTSDQIATFIERNPTRGYQLLAQWRGLNALKTLADLRASISANVKLEEAFRPVWQSLARTSESVFNPAGGHLWCVVPDVSTGAAVVSELRNFTIRLGGNALHGNERLTTAAAGEPHLFKVLEGAEGAFGGVHKRTLPLDSSFVGAVHPTGLHMLHEDAAPLRLGLQVLSQLHLHREIREVGGAYGASARAGYDELSGMVSFGTYRDPTPERSIEILDGARSWLLRPESLTQRAIDEAKLSVFGGLDAPVPPPEVGLRHVIQRVSAAEFADYRERLRGVTRAEIVRAVERHLPETLRNRASVCVLGPSEQ